MTGERRQRRVPTLRWPLPTSQSAVRPRQDGKHHAIQGVDRPLSGAGGGKEKPASPSSKEITRLARDKRSGGDGHKRFRQGHRRPSLLTTPEREKKKNNGCAGEGVGHARSASFRECVVDGARSRDALAEVVQRSVSVLQIQALPGTAKRRQYGVEDASECGLLVIALELLLAPRQSLRGKAVAACSARRVPTRAENSRRTYDWSARASLARRELMHQKSAKCFEAESHNSFAEQPLSFFFFSVFISACS